MQELPTAFRLRFVSMAFLLFGANFIAANRKVAKI
jgi:hypothetical protein